jgi:hypothetical protein
MAARRPGAPSRKELQMSRALEAAAEAVRSYMVNPDGGVDASMTDLARAAISAYLKALAEDEAVVERVARAMLADELNVYDRHEREKAWGHESEIWLSNARAAIAAIEEQKP